jgi:hypothetical protein
MLGAIAKAAPHVKSHARKRNATPTNAAGDAFPNFGVRTGDYGRQIMSL